MLDLPSGQVNNLAVKRSPKGVSLKVHWALSGAPVETRSGLPKKKRKKRNPSKATKERNKIRGAVHRREKERQQH